MKVLKMDREEMRNSEAGSILLQVAIGLVVLIAFASFVVDQGLMYVGRTQAQNAADGAALAGATAWAFDESNHATPDANGFVVQSINNVSGKHRIGDQATHATTYAFGTVPDATGVCPAYLASLSNGTNCVRVNVYQNGENGSTKLPVFFSSLVGINSQGAKATTTAISGRATGSRCMKPWVIPDKFNDVNMNGGFDLGTDTYTNPGYKVPRDIGTTLLLNPSSPQDAIAPSNFFQVDVNNYYDDIVGCDLTVGIGTNLALSIDTAPGGSKGITANGIQALTSNCTKTVTVVIGLYNPEVFATSKQNGHTIINIVNMLGFKLSCYGGSSQRPNDPVYGTITGAPGDMIAGAPGPVDGAMFLKIIQIVQ